MWFKHPFSRKLFAFLWGGIAALVITVALLVSIARLLLPVLDQYRVQIESFASEQLGRPVQIGTVTAGWEGLEPDLRLQDVRILAQDGNSTWLSMREVRASLDILATIRHRRPEMGRISLVGGSVDVARHDDGSFSVAGVATGSGGIAGHGGRGLLQWLMARERVYLEGATLRWHDPRISSTPLEITQLNLDLRRIGDRYHLGGAGRLAGESDAELRFALDLSGDPERPATLRSRLYMEGQLQLGRWLNGEAFATVQRLGGALDFQLWAEGADRLDRLRAVVQGRELEWQPRIAAEQGGPVQAVRLDQAGSTLFWARRGHGWRLSLQDVQVVRDHRSWPVSGLQLAFSDQNGAPRWEMRSPFLRLEDINAALLTIPQLPMEAREAAAALALRGDLRDVAVRYDPGASHPLYAAARFADLSFAPWRKLPGLDGVDGEVRTNGSQGVLSLDSRNVRFTYGRLFRQPLQAQHIEGRLYWYPGPEGTRLYVPQFVAANEDVQARGRLRMDLPESDAPPFLDLLVDFRNGTVGQAPQYLPVGIMPPEVVQWLDRGLASGRVPQGRALVHGRLHNFPYEHDEGTFRVDFAAEDLILDYAEGWPRLEDGVAGLRFADRSLHADIYSGKLLGLDIGRGTVDIPHMGHDSVLALNTEAKGPLHEFLSYLRLGPLADDPPPLLTQIQAQHTAQSSVRVRLPLHDHLPPRIQGSVRFADNSLAWPQWNLSLEQLQGRLDFEYRDKAVYYDTDALKLRWRSAPASMTVRTSTVGNETQVLLDLNTRNDVQTLLGPQASPLGAVFKGTSAWNVRATVHEPLQDAQPVAVDVQVRSDLRGVAVDLPSPLTKTAAEDRSILLTAQLGEAGLRQVRFIYGSVLNGVVGLNNGVAERGELRFGAEQAQLPQAALLRLAGATERLSVSQWREWLGRAGKGGHQRTAADWAERLRVIDVAVGELEVMGRKVHDLRLDARRDEDAWTADLHAAEVAGQVRIPWPRSSAGPVRAQLDYLHWGAQDGSAGSANGGAIDPTSLPALRIEVGRFTYADVALGRLSLHADPIPSGIGIKQAQLDGANFHLGANGEWRAGPRGQESDFVIDASTDDLGQALEDGGFTGTIERGAANLHIQAQWPGSPGDFALKNLDGNVRLLITDGQLLALDPKGGRIFGLLSVQALPRRLSLDFSDLFRKGFGFDRIQGTFTIADGDAYTNDLYMEGPAARIDVAGRIGLAAEDYDQTALVTPRVSASIPVVGGLAGGPAVGLGLWVAERMFGKKIDELSRVRYSITGSWQDPVVTRVEDAG